MANTDLGIMIVDDTKFSSALVSRIIQGAGYRDIRRASSALTALEQLEERRAQLIIADWLMPEMDGLDLTRRVRQLDEADNRYTYVILLTAREGAEALREAFDEGVDDFVSKSVMNEQLLHRIMAADRLVSLQNRILMDNQRLLDQISRLRKQSVLDPLTGLGNEQYALRRLDDAQRQAKSRGGAACLLLIRIDELEALSRKLGKALTQQLMLALSRRLKQMVRPMDILARLGPDTFGIITHQPDLTHCTPGSYRRIYDGMNNRAVKTAAGFHAIRVSMSVCACDEKEPASAKQMLQWGLEALPESHTTQRIVEARRGSVAV